MMGSLIYFRIVLKNKMSDLFMDERGEVNIVAIVVLIGIAVILAAFFKDQIKKLLDTLFTAISGKASDAVTKNVS
ncbi:Flp1 family type IVb pilin [Anaerocolumna xylanovorans]|uniref:Flagellin N-terminal-like domain-containing protein n=1 Tax=Anaerocolumna xylanovorans DSM 12503 TaxID=1121345 RepID=A0A1M7YJM6_9FIRM|nr:Flp1 family type IVb pilin [Anaerocolumna xylanovorans]SHO52825.1 flagellin N-terminal-like domain-containing protein [Anaerocolumna xylanovorans DSM 12503]